MSKLAQFSRERFEGLDVGQSELKTLKQAFEREVASRVFGTTGLAGLASLIAELNQLGHRFRKRKSDPGWTTYVESTNAGEREFFIHAQPERPGDVGSVMVLYHETLKTTVKKRVAAMSPRDRAKAKIESDFADWGLKLNTQRRRYTSLTRREQLIAALHELEGGVSNGGFTTYLMNTQGARVADAGAFLKEIGARKAARIVAGVVALLPAAARRVSRKKFDAHIDANQERLESLTDEFYAKSENIALLAMRFTGARKEGR